MNYAVEYERTMRAMRRMAPGTMSGESRVATPASPPMTVGPLSLNRRLESRGPMQVTNFFGGVFPWGLSVGGFNPNGLGLETQLGGEDAGYISGFLDGVIYRITVDFPSATGLRIVTTYQISPEVTNHLVWEFTSIGSEFMYFQAIDVTFGDVGTIKIERV